MLRTCVLSSSSIRSSRNRQTEATQSNRQRKYITFNINLTMVAKINSFLTAKHVFLGVSVVAHRAMEDLKGNETSIYQ